MGWISRAPFRLSWSWRGNATKGGIVAIAVLALAIVPGCGTRKTADGLAASKPNIVLILADDLSYRDLSIWGQDKFSTPNLDALARGGLRFTQAYAGAPECAPSRGTLMTGRHTGHGPIRANASARGQEHLSRDDVTVAELLKEAGYATAFVGKWGIGLPGTEGTPDKQGFDYSFGFYDQRRAHTYFPNYLFENGKKIPLPENYGFDMDRLYRYNRAREPAPADLNRYDPQGRLIPAGIPVPEKASYSEKLIEEAALRFVDRHAKAPFFLYFATQLPHGPTIVDDLGEMNGRADYPSLKHKEWAAMVRRLDHFTGELVARLKQLGVYENTIIFFASDNGYSECGYFGRGNANNNWPDDPFLKNKGPFRGGKFSALEGGIRVPFFVHWKGKVAPGVSNEPVWLLDFYPTAVELSAAPVRHEIDGVSLVPLLAGQAVGLPARPYMYWEKRDEQAVRMGPWKAYRPHPRQPVQLFLIEEDTYSDRDLASFYPEVVQRIEHIMSQAHTDHPWYHNPGETKADDDAKRKLAEESGELQTDVLANSTR